METNEPIGVSLADLDRALDLARERGARTWIALPDTSGGMIASRDLRSLRALAVTRGKLAATLTVETVRGTPAIVAQWPSRGPSRGARVVLGAFERLTARTKRDRADARAVRPEDGIVTLVPTALAAEPATPAERLPARVLRVLSPAETADVTRPMADGARIKLAPTMPQEAPAVSEDADDRAGLDLATRRRLAVNAALGVGSRFMVAS